MYLRDLVHRQTACAAIKHLALGVAGFGCEDALIHLLNYTWPNIFETSPHLVQAFIDQIEGMRVALGPQKLLDYALQVKTTLEKVKRPRKRHFPALYLLGVLWGDLLME